MITPELVQEILDWWDTVPGHTPANGKKLLEEAQELVDAQFHADMCASAPGQSPCPVHELKRDLEAADVLITLVIFCREAGVRDLSASTREKLKVLYTRTWSEPDENGVRHHI